MDNDAFFEWLIHMGLANTVKGSFRIFKKIYIDCLGIKSENVLIICDEGLPEHRIAPLLAGCYYFAAKDPDLNAEIVFQKPKFIKEPASSLIIKKLAALPEKSVIILCPSGKTGAVKELGTTFRKFVRRKQHKFISSTYLGHLKTEYFYSMLNLIDVDYMLLNRVGNRIKAVLDAGREIHVTTAAGTDLRINIEGQEAINNSGIYWKKGTGGNIPAGEVYIAPSKLKVNGVVVIDGSVRTTSKTFMAKTPVKLTIADGCITKFEGGAVAKELEDSLTSLMKKAKNANRIKMIGEFGIGTNPKSRFLGPTLINEKTWTTAHIAIGSNYWFGGSIKTIVHLDQVFKYPIIKVDGRLLKV